MADVYMYADETGNLDFATNASDGVTPYFGFGTATFVGPHPEALWRGFDLRIRLQHLGLGLAAGFHAKNDSWATRATVLAEIGIQKPRFDFTLLNKTKATEAVRLAGEMGLYKMAWYLHFKTVARQISTTEDTLYVIVASFGTKQRSTQARAALDEVCQQVGRQIELCVWDAPTSWGLQLADYATWALQRHIIHDDLAAYEAYIAPSTQSVSLPWGSHSTPAE